MGEAWRRIVASGAVDRPSPRCADPAPAGLIEGIQLFNAGEYFECHEVLEAIWREERDPIRYLYQGILQIGVGLHHLRNGNYRGATLLLHDGIDKTRRFTPRCMGVDTLTLCDRAQECLDTLQTLGRERISDFDWSLVPVISGAWDADDTEPEIS
ncbi:MAG TPA: DUF309 domain-containing protein [Thermomicrobiales bacterium]|nr:DUF309 domain-containing protein [Thermomicrobiales bacterium]